MHGVQERSTVACNGEEMNWNSHINAESPHADMILAIPKQGPRSEHHLAGNTNISKDTKTTTTCTTTT